MHEPLLTLQYSVYTAAIPYPEAETACLALLLTAFKETLMPVVARYNSAADEYEEALLVLWHFLDGQLKGEYIQQQIDNTLSLLNSLNKSRDLVKGQVEKRNILVPIASR